MKLLPRFCRNGSTAALVLAGATAVLLSGACSDDDPALDTDGETDPSADDGGTDGTGDAFFSSSERATILSWLGPLPETVPADTTNAWADDLDAAQLGQALFFDTRLSSNGTTSCATCHEPNDAFSDNRANTSEGVGFTPRSSMSILNTAYGAAAEQAQVWQFWDGRRDSQWSQALGPLEDPVEMGSSRTDVALLILGEYSAAYEEVFGPLPELSPGGQSIIPAGAKPGTPEWDAASQEDRDAVTSVFVNVGKAIAAYERRLVSRNSRFDDFWQELSDGAEDSDALSDQEKEGLRVFINSGRCLGCHSGPNFTDGQFHNIAVAQFGENVPAVDLGRKDGIESLRDDEFNCASEWSDYPQKDDCSVSKLASAVGEDGAFKTPSLRGTGLTPPYMHTGHLRTLDEVVAHYDLGGSPPGAFSGTRDELMRPLGLDLPQRQALVAFLLTLDGEPVDPSLVGTP